MTNMPRDTSDYPNVRVPDLFFNSNYRVVSSLANLPAPSGGIITIPAGMSIFILGTVDLQGNRLVCAGTSTFKGNGPESSILLSTGLPAAQALITSTTDGLLEDLSFWSPVGTTMLRYAAILVNRCYFGRVALGAGGTAIEVINASNAIFYTIAMVTATNGIVISNSGGGTTGTVTFRDCLLGTPFLSGSYLRIESSAVITRRINMFDTSIIAFGTSIGVNRIAGSTFQQANSIILRNVNFTGVGTYLAGVTANDGIALFNSCVGIENTSFNASGKIQNNVTATTLVQSVWTVPTGTFTVQNLRNFTQVQPVSFTYIGQQSKTFGVVVSFGGLVQNNVSMSLSFDVNGLNTDSNAENVTSVSSTDVTRVSLNALINLVLNDVLQVKIRNNSNNSSVTAESVNLLIYEV